MEPLQFIFLAFCGGLGATTRFFLDGLVKQRTRSALPWGTITINLSGSFLLGLLTGLVLHHVAAPEWQLIIGTGFLGGYTTFSTASFETIKLIQTGKIATALVNSFGTLTGSVLAALLGLWVAGIT